MLFICTLATQNLAALIQKQMKKNFAQSQAGSEKLGVFDSERYYFWMKNNRTDEVHFSLYQLWIAFDEWSENISC